MSQPPNEGLPTYGELEQAEGSRFGRWAGWIEKRAIEARQLRQENAQPSSWDLPDVPGANVAATQSVRRSQLSSGQRAEASLAPPQTNRPRLANVVTSSSSSASLPRARAGLVPGQQVTKLTPGVSIHAVGQRFLAQLPEDEPPTCAAVLSTQPSSAFDRYVLLGTKSGLWVCDLMPNLDRCSVKSASLEEAVVVQVWKGAAVHKLEIYDGDVRSGRPGIIVALTPPLEPPPAPSSSSSASASSASSHQHTSMSDQVRLWPVQAVLNLVKYRTLQPASTPVHLHVATPSASSDGAPTSRRASSLLGFKKAFSHYSDQADVKGKGKALSPTASNASDDFLLVNSSSSSLGSASEPNDLAESWAQSSVPLALPKNHLPIQLVRILVPPRLSTARGSADANLFLAIATKSSVYLFESKLGRQRAWAMVQELYTPQPATALDLVHSLSDDPMDLYTGARSSPQRPSPAHSRSSSDARIDHPTLSLFVRMKEKAVVIRLADAGVREVRPPEKAVGNGSQSPAGRRRRSSFSRSNSGRASTYLGGRRGSFSGDGLREAIQATLKIGKTDDWWTSCDRVSFSPGQSYLFITKGYHTEMAMEPLRSGSEDPVLRGALQLTSLHDWTWRTCPAQVHVHHQLTRDGQRARLCLVGVSSTGVEVHEGDIHLGLLRNSATVIWKPLVSPEEEIESHTSYDFSAPTQSLCRIRLPTFVDEGAADAEQGGTTSEGLVIATQAVGEWKLRMITS